MIDTSASDLLPPERDKKLPPSILPFFSLCLYGCVCECMLSTAYVEVRRQPWVSGLAFSLVCGSFSLVFDVSYTKHLSRLSNLQGLSSLFVSMSLGEHWHYSSAHYCCLTFIWVLGFKLIPCCMASVLPTGPNHLFEISVFLGDPFRVLWYNWP